MKNIFGKTKENWYLEELKQGQKVEFNTGVVIGIGVVCGISCNGVTLAGRSYIIKLDEPIKDFEYTHISLSEIFLKPIN
jgi:hypothetical protein